MTYKQEQWETIPGFRRYEVSTSGRVRARINRNGKLPYSRIMKAGVRSKPNGSKRRAIRLIDDLGVHRVNSVARLMLTAFVRQPKPGEQARHLNDNGTDDRLDNLAWGSNADNMADAKRNGRILQGEARTAARLNVALVRKLRSEWKPWDRAYSLGALARKYKLPRSTVQGAVLGSTWRSVS